MYSRTYPDENTPTFIPESYGGTALGRNESDYIEDKEEIKEEVYEETSAKGKDGGFLSFGSLPSFLTNIFPSLRGGKLFKNFGTEELLIIGAALLLFFSKEGDKECAILLILLLFVG